MSDRAQVSLLLEMLDSAYQRPIPADWTVGWHSMLSNLQHVRDEEWDWLPPPDGKRSIKRIVAHTAGVLLMYTDHGFGPGKMQWSDIVPPRGKETTRADYMQWFNENIGGLRVALSACTDDQLDEPREYWDPGTKPRRWFVTTMIDHLLYHAGEINYIRALAQKNDE
jgi:hypothetical protein